MSQIHYPARRGLALPVRAGGRHLANLVLTSPAAGFRRCFTEALIRSR